MAKSSNIGNSEDRDIVRESRIAQFNHIIDSFHEAVKVSNEDGSPLVYPFSDTELRDACIGLLEEIQLFIRENPGMESCEDLALRVGDASFILATLPPSSTKRKAS